MYFQNLPVPSRNRRRRRAQRHADGSPPIATTGLEHSTDRAGPTVQESVPASADRARDDFPNGEQAKDKYHSNEGNQERNPSVPNDDFARFLAESEERDLTEFLDGHSLNSNLLFPSPTSFSPPGTHFTNENVVDDLATSLAEVAHQLSFEQQGGPLLNESTTSPTSQSSLVGLPDSKSSHSGVSYTSTFGYQSIPTPHASCSSSPGSQATFLTPCEGSTTFGRDSLYFVNFSSCRLDIDNASSHSQHAVTISPQAIPSSHHLEAPFLQMRRPRSANTMANLRKEYLKVGFLQMREPMPNRGVGPFPDLTQAFGVRKHSKRYGQAAHLGLREPIAVSHPCESMKESLVNVSTSPRSADLRAAPRVDATMRNRRADIANRVSPVATLETDMVARRNAFEASYDRKARVSQPVPPTNRRKPTADTKTSVLPRPTIELLFHSGLRGTLYRLFLPLTKASLTKAEYEEALECIRLRKAMRNAEEDAKKRAKEAELKGKKKRKWTKSRYMMMYTESGLE
ncbi:hypothetical protein BGX38DRAFT_1267767 [Terfezia claveryi]|nr:hypothetical protein BGX38DRAFT_1267767 [Terfezia claveryi]